VKRRKKNSEQNGLLAPNEYHDSIFDYDAVKILPSQYYVTMRDIMIVTVLGSCVSACIRDRVSGIGGMNHFMLPGRDVHDITSTSARYGGHAMEVLINQILKLGGLRRNLEAKLFGGAMTLQGLSPHTVGEMNTEFAMHYLDVEGIPLLAQDVLDSYPRKVYFFPKTGRVMVRLLKTVHNNTILEREQEYESRLRRIRFEGDVELFL
jgi:chemotaxis protein CheD